MYKRMAGLLFFLAIFSGISSMGVADPIASAIRGLESTLLLLAALVFLVLEDKRGK